MLRITPHSPRDVTQALIRQLDGENLLAMQQPILNAGLSELKQWHAVTLDFHTQARLSESDPSTFRDHRLDVTFSHKDGETGAVTTVTVPGYFAGDGDAADSGATAGDTWRVRFNPPETGQWTYQASFLAGKDVAIGSGRGRGVEFDGTSGSFTVGETDKTGDDFRGKGMLRHDDGDRYLTFAGSGEVFLKAGPGSPENFLAYDEFDGTYDLGKQITGNHFLHSYAAHRAHGRAGDPTWHGENGTGDEILGALNYLAGKGANSLYLITMTRKGDGDDVWPWASPDKRTTFDVSKLDQWGRVFEHAQKNGIHLNLFTQERENSDLLDGGGLGVERQLYYRELIARFGHNNALTWNLGEESANSDGERKAFASYIRDLDPYDHPITVHTWPSEKAKVYNPLLGYRHVDGPSLQSGDGHGVTLEWLEKSAAAGQPWFVTFDEFGGASYGTELDRTDPDHDGVRSEYLWGNLMAGGSGVEFYVGYKNRQTDLTLDDFTALANVWEQADHALAFFDRLPVSQMRSMDDRLPQNEGRGPSAVEDYVFAKAGSTYAVYLEDGGTTKLDLSGTSGTFNVRWYDPRNGGAMEVGSVAQVKGGGLVDLGKAPGNLDDDWVTLVTRTADPSQPPTPPKVDHAGGGAKPVPTGNGNPVGKTDDAGKTVTLEAKASMDGKTGPVAWGEGVTVKAMLPGGADATLSSGPDGLGVAGGRTSQIDYDGKTGRSEKLLIDFGRDVTDVELALGRFNSNEHKGLGETGAWVARDDDGAIVAQGRLDATDGTRTGKWAYDVAIDTDAAFQTLELRATAYGHGLANVSGDQSDFALEAVSFTFIG